jgi:hypothetical protein
MSEMDGMQINTELLYTQAERTKARVAYASDYPSGPSWELADRHTRGRYLEAAGRSWLVRLED